MNFSATIFDPESSESATLQVEFRIAVRGWQHRNSQIFGLRRLSSSSRLWKIREIDDPNCISRGGEI